MAKIPSSGRLFWTKTNASIPASWTRDTSFDDRFLQGAKGEPGANGGSSSHNHTGDLHTHTQNAHNHSLSVGGTSGSLIVQSGLNSTVVSSTHGHTKNSNDATATNLSMAPTIDSTTAKPPFTRVIVIKPDDANQGIPVDGVVLANSDISGADLKITDGLNSTTDLDGRFLHGMTTGGDGGGTGGSLTHNHTSPSHNHTQNAHNHGSGSSGTPTGFFITHNSGFNYASHKNHVHTITYNNATATNNATAINVNTASSEPAYIELLGIQNRGSGQIDPPIDTVIPYVGNISTIPSPWKLCNGSSGSPDCVGRQVKVTKTPANIKNTGGSNTHTHTSPSHNHTQNSHTHTVSAGAGSSIGLCKSSRSGVSAATTTHTHTWNIGNTVAVNNSTAATMSTDDVRYLYREVLFIILANTPTVHIKGGAIKGATIL